MVRKIWRSYRVRDDDLHLLRGWSEEEEKLNIKGE